MSRLIDPTICPDCRGRLDANAQCTDCGLHLVGPLAGRLWSAMTDADTLVEQLRFASTASRVPSTITVATPAPAAPAPARPAPPAPPVPGPAPAGPRRRLPALSVPVVLLSLGALCLLVAAVVFVAVTWGHLGLTGRTLVLLGFTGLMGGVAAVLARRGLRGAAETFWLMVAVMLGLDLLAARSAGLFGLDSLSWRQNGVLVGTVLFLLGTTVGTWARRTPSKELYVAQLTAVVGALTGLAAGCWLAENHAVGALVGVLLAGALAALLERPLAAVASSLVVLAGVSWLELVAVGVGRTLEVSALGAWWQDARGWPLLAAALVVGAVSLLPRVPSSLRPLPAGLSLAALALLANSPHTPGTDTRDAVLRCATVLALALLTRVAPTAWSIAAAVLATAGSVVLLAQLAVVPWGEYADPAASWTHVVAAAAVVATIWAGRRLLPAEAAADVREPALVLAVATVALGVAGTVLDLHPALTVSVGTLLVATAVVAGLTWALGRRTSWAFPVTVVGGLATAYLAAVTLYAARTDSLLTALAATAMTLGLVAATVVTELDDDEDVAPALLGGLAVLAATYALPAWCDVADLGTRTSSLVITSYAVAALLAARPLTRRTTTRVALEATAIVPALVGVALAPDTVTGALALTIVGSALAVLAAVLRDRSYAAWGAVGVLALATWLRLETGTDRPELWVLPAALLLVGVGLRQRRTTVVGGGLGGVAVALVAILADTPLDTLAAAETTVLALLVAGAFALLERAGATAAGPAAAALAALAGGAAVQGWCSVLDTSVTASALTLAGYAGAVGVLAAPATRRTASRVVLEVTAALLAVVAVATTEDERALAMALTIVGSAVAIVAVTNRDRAQAGWIGAVVLAAATAVRVWVGVPAPELYTLPAAALLIAAGLWRLQTDEEVDSLTALGSGLSLALLPSLLLALQEPVSTRALLVGAGGAVALALGVQRRLTAPFLLGAGTVALLAVRHLGPVTEAVPRWVSLGLLGLALLVVGITWEARLRNLQTARHYLTALR